MALLDYYAQTPFWGGAGKAGENIADTGAAIANGIRRRRQTEMEARRQDELERHQMQQEQNSAALATIAEKRQLAAEDFTRSQSALADQRNAQIDAREKTRDELAAADRRKATVTDIGRAFGQGRPMQAQAVAGASQFVDPRTGQMAGVKLEQEPLPPGPGPAPVEPQPPEFVGPLEDPEEARMRAMGRVFGNKPGEISFDPDKAPQADQEGTQAAAEVQRQQALRDQFGKDQEAFPAQQQQYTAAKATHDEAAANPRYRASFPGGESVPIDPREEKNAQAADRHDQASKLRQAAAQPGQLPDVARSMLLAADNLESGISNADKAPITNMNAAVQSQGYHAGQNDQDRALKRDQARMKAIAKGQGKGQGAGLERLSAYIKTNPDDQPGQYAMAEQLGYRGPKAAALVDKLQNDFKAGKARADEETNTLVRDEQGNPIGHVPTGRGGAQGFATRDADYARGEEQLNALLADLQAHGERVISPESIKRRKTLYHNAVIGVATVSPLGKTNEAMEAEAGSLGNSGAGLDAFAGANTAAVARKIEELRAQRQRYRKESLIPLGPGEARTPARSAAQPAAPAQGTRKLRMPDGSVAVFDASGRRIQ